MYKILVVDDEPDFRNTLAGLLEDAGYVTRGAANEGEALAAIAQEPFDFAFIDVRLHGGEEGDESGLSLAMALRTLRPRTRVILLTQYVRSHQIVRAIRYHGVLDFIEKTPDVGKQILKTLASAHREIESPRFGTTGGTTCLRVSLDAGKPVAVRAQGRHVFGMHTSRILDIDVHRFTRRVDVARQETTPFRYLLKSIGSDLWTCVFAEQPEISRAYYEARAKSELLSLVFEIPRSLLQLPLELMYTDSPADYLALQHPFVRFAQDTTPNREAISPAMMSLSDKLRVLIIASNTLPPISGADAEAKELYYYLRSQNSIPVTAKLIHTESATYDRVRLELRKRSYDIIHYAGHSSYNPQSPEESCLYFWANENMQGHIVELRATELKMLLHSSEARLVYLSSSGGASAAIQPAEVDDDFLGLVDAVVQAGVPSVLGFRWPVSDNGARELALAFYRSLLEQGSPEIALWRARRELAALNRDDVTWLSPILVHQS